MYAYRFKKKIDIKCKINYAICIYFYFRKKNGKYSIINIARNTLYYTIESGYCEGLFIAKHFNIYREREHTLGFTFTKTGIKLIEDSKK